MLKHGLFQLVCMKLKLLSWPLVVEVDFSAGFVKLIVRVAMTTITGLVQEEDLLFINYQSIQVKYSPCMLVKEENQLVWITMKVVGMVVVVCWEMEDMELLVIQPLVEVELIQESS